jgi:hypothetical protein
MFLFSSALGLPTFCLLPLKLCPMFLLSSTLKLLSFQHLAFKPSAL